MPIPPYITKHVIDLYNASQETSIGDIRDRRKTFKNILKSYYPWISKKELNTMYEIVIYQETEKDRKNWVKNVKDSYKDKIIRLFGKIDSNSDGVIDINEFKNIIKINVNFDDKVAENMFNKADKDNNGTLDFDEFTELLSNNKFLRENLYDILKISDKRKEVSHKNRLSIIFKNIPTSPLRQNWRPSLANIRSPTKASDHLSYIRFSDK